MLFLQVINNTVPKSPVFPTDVTVVKDWFTPMLIAGITILVGIIVQRIVIVYIRRLAKRTRWKGASVLANSLRGMIILVSLLLGVYIGLTKAPLDPQTIVVAHKVHLFLTIFIITFVIARVLTGLLRVYSHSREQSSKGSLSLFKSIINIAIYSIGLLVMLQSFGVSIAPVLTALGVGGLAVALALQDTLSNLFAGIQITLTRTIKPGDYIHLSSGEEGTVTDITWRSTTLTTQSDNMTVIPNSKLSTNIITNYSLPRQDFSITIKVGVGYGSDLDKVEQVTLEVARQAMKALEIEGDATFRYKEFGDSSISFNISMDINQFSQQYILRHEFIKSLYKRFNAEGIDIPFPTTSVYLKKEN